MLDRVSVKIKLLMGFSLVALVMLAMGLLQIAAVNNLSSELRRIVHLYPNTDAAMEMRYAVARIMQIGMEVIASQDMTELTGFEAEMAEHEAMFREMSTAVSQGGETSEGVFVASTNKELLAALRAIMLEYDQFTAAVQALRKEKRRLLQAGSQEETPLLREQDEKMDALGSSLIESLGSLEDVAKVELGAAVREGLSDADADARQSGWLMAGGMLLALGLGLVTILGILRPLGALRCYVNAVASGNLKAQAAGCGGAEIGALCADVERMVAELKRRLGFAQGILDGITLPAVVCDTQERIQFVNAPTLRLLGKGGAPQSFHGQSLGEFFHGDARSETVTGRAVRQCKVLENQDATLRRQDGSQVRVKVDAAPVYDLDGACIAGFGLVTDLTEMLRREEEAESRRAQLAELARQAQGVADQLAESAASLAERVDQASQGAGEQSRLSQEAATAMDEMHATVMEVARGAGEAATLAGDAETTSGQGAAAVREAVALVEQMNSLAEALTQDMRAMGQRSQDIN